MDYPIYPKIHVRHYPDGFTMASCVRIKRDGKMYLVDIYQETRIPPNALSLAITEITLNGAKRFAEEVYKIQHIHKVDLSILNRHGKPIDVEDTNQEEESERLLRLFPKK